MKAYYGTFYVFSRKETSKRESRHCSVVGEINPHCYFIIWVLITVLRSAGIQGGDWDSPHLSNCLMLMWLCDGPSCSPDTADSDPRSGSPAKTAGQKDQGGPSETERVLRSNHSGNLDVDEMIHLRTEWAAFINRVTGKPSAHLSLCKHST